MSNTSTALMRIKKDLQKIAKEDDPGFVIDYDQSNLMKITAYIAGPQKTMWQEGMFELSFTFSDQYPNKCPEVVFKSKMFHPNIYNDGRICLDLLTTQWSSSYDIMAILVSIRSLLNTPNPNSPANATACQIYTKNIIQYERRVKQIVSESLMEDEDEE